jgi:plasmid stabilization system protein ParE
MSPGDRGYVVRVLQPAQDDLLEVVSLIATDSPEAAESFVDRFEWSLERLARYPRSGRVPGDARLAGAGYRYLVLLDYLVFYTIEKRVVLVHRIIHGARDYLGLL